MQTRILTTAILWAIISLAVGFGGISGGQVLLLMTALGVLWELTWLLKKLHFSLSPFALLVALALTLGGHMWGQASLGTSLALITVVAAHWKTDGYSMVAALMSVITVAVGLGSLAAIVTLPHASVHQVIWVIAVVKLADGGAYLSGTLWGRRALAPKISPGKTVEGFFGALLGGLIIGALGAPLFCNLFFAAILGLVLAFVGSVGDLLASALKRGAGVKDSGRILPGIGGMLDLCDSLLLAGPVAYLIIRAL